MNGSIELHQQMRDSINNEIADRTKSHQSAIAGLKAAGAPLASGPLVMLAHGDSWFDYPLSGNDLSLVSTDVIAQLGSMGAANPVILNLSHHGDATTDEMSLPKQQRMIESLQDPSNWMDHGKPDAILFSGGGNDIAGNQFCIFLDHSDTPGSTGLNDDRFQKVLDAVEASYLDLFAFRDRYAPDVPIYGQCYDFPIPDGTAPACAGPWLKPSLDFNGWKLWQGIDILKQALTEFKQLLLRLASVPANNFKLVDTQGLLEATDWANELHPFPDGFKKIAAKFVDALRLDFPGRI
jgi:hypothetical protein